jgi:hypothetical protein
MAGKKKTGFRAKAKGMQKQYKARVKEAQERKEEKIEFGSIFDKEKIPKGIEFWRPEKGEHLIDVLPFFTGKQNPRNNKGDICHVLDLWVHMRVGPEGLPVVCPKRNWDKRCPICEWMNANRSYPENLKVKRRTVYLVWVHDEERKEEKKGPMLWEVAYYFFAKHLDEISQLPRGGGQVTYQDHEKGKSIHFKVKASGSYIDAEGKKRDSIEFTGHQFLEREAPIPDAVLNKQFPLDEAIKMHPEFEYIEKMLGMGTDDAEEEIDDNGEVEDDGEELDTGAEETGDEEEDEDTPELDEEEDEDEEDGDGLDDLSRKELKALRTEEGHDFKVTKSMSDDDVREKLREFRAAAGGVDEEEDEDEPDEPEDDGLDDLDRKALKKIRTDEGLDFKVTKSMTDDDVREKIREHRGSGGGGGDQECIAGGTFGKDNDDYEQCMNECAVYDDCAALSEGA